MLTVDLGADGWPVLTQEVRSPSVYLDHWAAMNLAEKETERFTRILLRRGGTVLISWMHLLEFSKVKSPSTAQAVESFLDGLERHVAFIEPNSGKVVDREDLIANRPGTDAPPELDGRLLKIVSMNAKAPEVFSFKGLLKIAQSSLDAQWRLFEASMGNTSSILAKQRRKFLDDPAYAQVIKARLSGPPLKAPTRYVLREMLNGLIRDGRTQMGPRQWADYGHTVVAVSYADFALLDKGWVHRAEEARRRLAPAGLSTRFARVFSQTTIDTFWKAFDV